MPARSVQRNLTTEIKHRLDRTSEQNCQRCGLKQVKERATLNGDNPPPLIALGLEDRRHIDGTASQPKLSSQVTIGEDGNKVVYKVRGLIYWDKSHFTCRMIGKSNEVYYHDGMTTRTNCLPEGKLKDLKGPYNTKNAQLNFMILSPL